MKIFNFEQRSQEWHAIRCGKPSASSFDKIVTTDGKPSKQREKYLYKLAAERISGMAEETYQNGAMLRGIEMEAEARMFYEVISDDPVLQVGFCLTDDETFGASPDGMVGDHGLLEIKCPEPATHVSYLLQDRIPPEYWQQTQGQLLVTGRDFVDFLSYYPGIKPLIYRVKRDEVFLKTLETELKKFCKELDEVTEKIK